MRKMTLTPFILLYLLDKIGLNCYSERGSVDEGERSFLLSWPCDPVGVGDDILDPDRVIIRSLSG